jgi:hypothetical protein
MLTDQKYSVVRATLRQATPHARHLDGEPTITPTPLEFPIVPGRPNSQDSVTLESGTNGSQSTIDLDISFQRNVMSISGCGGEVYVTKC